MLEKIADPKFAGVSKANVQALSLVGQILQTNDAPTIYEVGVGVGATTVELCRLLANRGVLHIFDFSSKVAELHRDLRALGFNNVMPRGNSPKTYDSYSWELAKLALDVRSGKERRVDLAFLDGAHVFLHDAPATILLKQMLGPGGLLLFDDYNWTMGKSPTMNPTVHPETRARYTDEQIERPHIQLICTLFMDDDPGFELVDLSDIPQSGNRRAYRKRSDVAVT